MLKLACQFLIKNKKKSFAIFSSIVLSVALLVGTGALLLSANISKSKYYAEIEGNYQYHYKINEKQLKKLPEVLKETKADVESYGVSVDLYNTDVPKVMSVAGCDAGYLKMNGAALLKGRMAKNESEVVVEQWAVGNLGLKEGIGESLKVENQTFHIVGIVSDSYEKNSGVIKAYTALEKHGSEERYDLYVNFPVLKDIRKQALILMDELGCKNKDLGVNWDVVEPLGIKAPAEPGFSVMNVVKGISLDENMVTLLFGIFSAFIIYSMMSVITMQRRKQYGTLEAIGAEGRHLFTVIFSEVLLLFLAGFPVGSALGVLGAEFLYGKFSYIFISADVSAAQFVVSRKVMLNGFFLLLILLALAAAKTVHEMKKQTNIDAGKSAGRHLLKNRKIMAHRRKSLIACVSHRYMTLKRGVFAGIVCSLAIGGIIFCGTDYVTSQAKQENELKKSDDGLNSDYFISMQTSSFEEGLSKQQVKQLGKVKGVSDVSPVKHFLGGTYVSEDKYTNKHFFDPANKDERLKEYFNGICTKEENGNYFIKGNIYGYGTRMLQNLNQYLVEGSIDEKKMREENSVIVCLPQDGGTLEFNTVNLKPGDSIKVKVPKNLDAKDDALKFNGEAGLYEIKEFKIAATVKRVMAYNDFFIGRSGMDIIMTNDMMSREFQINHYNMVSMSKEASAFGRKTAEEIQEIVRKTDRCMFRDYTELIEKENMNLQQRQMFFMGLALIIIFISMFHIANSMNFLIVSRKQEFGILRAMGLSDRDFKMMVLKEGLLYGITSSIVMFAGVMAVTWLLMQYMKNVSMLHEPEFTLHWLYIGICVTINLVLSTFAVFAASKPVLKEEVVECMKKEG